MGTKVINELRLPLSDPQAQKIFDQHMREFLNLSQ
jgi:Fe-S cluster biosynthesis and repair protein YggX